MTTNGKASFLLPQIPRGMKDPWGPLRRELQQRNLHLTILGLTPEGMPHVKIVGPSDSLRRWLDELGYTCVAISKGSMT